MLTKEGVTYSLVVAIGETPLVPLFYKHIAELMEAGHCTFHTFELVTNYTSAIIAEVDSKIVGFDLFNHDKKIKMRDPKKHLSEAHKDLRQYT